MGTLYLVSTPIGNLKDITLRALEVLKSVDLVLCEDTRKTGFLLSHYKIKNRLLSYFEHNEARRIPEVIAKLKEGQDTALVSNAGTPTISDPGFKLVRQCLAEGIRVCPIPGASAILAALVASGLPTDKFTFLGFLPRKKGPLAKLLQQCSAT
ncbi:16S rRNA (cytidine(1402)-2'-O)-methyltransferase, partial [Candidatus Parcubacteria bacterium]|nr:16S rRNA (cytidine(1402)-2'-O)-methyltransferase [Candidatus Parcubacteria bacterium]